MSRTTNTDKRLSKIEARHKLKATIKPVVASKGTVTRTGFSKKMNPKQSKGYRTSHAPKPI